MKKILLILIINFVLVFSQQKKIGDNSNINDIQILRHNNNLPINQIYYNTGNYTTGTTSSIRWPDGINTTNVLIASDALSWGGIINDTVRTNGALGSGNTIQPGKIFDDGKPDNPTLEKYRVFKIIRGWETLPSGEVRNLAEKDYNEWPVEDGAPWEDVDGNGFFTRGIDKPQIIGDGTLFYVYNHLGSSNTAKPVAIEVQVTVWAFIDGGDLGDVFFRQYKFINKSEYEVKDMYLALSSQVGLGYRLDNFIGCDTTLNLAYAYNQINFDNDYGVSPPAQAHLVIKGPTINSDLSDSAFVNGLWYKGKKNIGMTSFSMKWIPLLGDRRLTSPLPPSSFFGNIDEQYYNIQQGKKFSGYPIIDPWTRNETTFMVPGDPVTKTGWFEGDGWLDAFDMPKPRINIARSYDFGMGSFNFAPRDTQTIIIATYGARGGNNLDAVEVAKRKANVYQHLYLNNFFIAPPVPSPTLHSFSDEDEINLWWDIEAESYNEIDINLINRKFPDTTYTFEGYRIWQYKDINGSNPKLVTTLDRSNGVRVINGIEFVNGVPVLVPIIYGNDTGIKRILTLTKDIFTGEDLFNGNPYYFGITAYAYSGRSSPLFLESKPYIIEVMPGRNKIDYKPKHEEYSFSNSFQTSGESDGYVDIKILDPTAITGDTYEVLFERFQYQDIAYTLINKSKEDTLYIKRTEFGNDSINKVIADGFILIPINTGLDSTIRINAGDRLTGVNKVLEIKGPNGVNVSPPKDVVDKFNSTNEWKIVSFGYKGDMKQNINWINQIGVDEYEIRFTAEGSEYYTTGYSGIRPALNDDPKGKGRVPFEIYNIGTLRDKNERMVIKVWDKDLRDTAWTKDNTTDEWEYIFAHLPESEYQEPLPNSSGAFEKERSKIGYISFKGELPKEGTVIRITPFKPFQPGDKFEFILEKPNFSDVEIGKENIDKISVFPNPYFGKSEIENGGQSFVRFTGLPTNVVIRIYTLSGVLVDVINKSDINQYIDWDLKNEEGLRIASGIYVAHLDMPGIGDKILKMAIVMSKEYLTR